MWGDWCVNEPYCGNHFAIYIQCISNWTSHISHDSQPHVARGRHIGQCSSTTGVPNCQAVDWHSRRWVAGEQTKLHLPLPITPHRSALPAEPPPNPPPSPPMEKLSSMKTVPGAKMVGDSCSTRSGLCPPLQPSQAIDLFNLQVLKNPILWTFLVLYTCWVFIQQIIWKKTTKFFNGQKIWMRTSLVAQ